MQIRSLVFVFVMLRRYRKFRGLVPNCAPVRIKGLVLPVSDDWNGGLKLDGVSDGTAPATLGGLHLAPGLCLCGFLNHGPATRLVRIAKALPKQTTMGFPRWMPPLVPAFGFWRSGLGWCRAATTTATEQTHIRGAHVPR